MGKYKGPERREAPRIECRNVLVIFHRKPGLIQKLLGQKSRSHPLPVRNISRDGICFLSKTELKTGEVLSLTIDFGPHSPTIHTEGKVLRCEPGKGRYQSKIAVGFTHIPNDAWSALNDLENICPKHWFMK